MPDRAKSGESLVHLVSCLVDAIEDGEDHEQDDPVRTAYAQVHQHIEEFEPYHAEHDAANSDCDSQSPLNEAMVTQHINNATGPYTNADEHYFPVGDEDHTLKLAAQN